MSAQKTKLCHYCLIEGLEEGSKAVVEQVDNILKMRLSSEEILQNPTKSIVTILDDCAQAVFRRDDIAIQETNRVSPIQLVVVLIIDDICLTASIGSCRALMSSSGGMRLYCLNTEHAVPGNESEERRIC